jgi:phosphoglycolate phosphatase
VGGSGSHPFGAVVFDLDGTLVDSRPGIEASARIALRCVVPRVEMPDVRAQLGRPLDGLISVIGATLTADQRVRVREAFVQHYDAEGWRGSVPYPGVTVTLAALRHHGLRLFVASNKRHRPAELILAASGLAQHIEGLYTADSAEPPGTDKTEMAAACVEAHALKPSMTLVVGDSREDQTMAAANDLSFAAAAWGYGDAVSAVLDSGVANTGYLSQSSERPIQTVLACIGDLMLLVLPEVGAGRGP